MKKSIIFSTLALLSLGVTFAVMGDDDGYARSFRHWYGQNTLDVAPTDNTLYLSECGSCHFAYQPGLLPARSWKKLMGGLEDHFGDNAELDADVQQQLSNYLQSNAADQSSFKRSTRINASIAQDEVPLRITDTLYFRRKHHEIPARIVRANQEVGSFSNCSACHTQAAQGSYNEHQVRIPGIGHWED